MKTKNVSIDIFNPTAGIVSTKKSMERTLMLRAKFLSRRNFVVIRGLM
jgi:hypothetical protein